MGTGVISILWMVFPYGDHHRTIRAFSAIFFFLNFVLWIIFTGITVARYVLFPEVLPVMIKNPASLFIACYPMGATTLIDVAVGLLYEQYWGGGRGFLYTLWAFWWIIVAMSIVCAWGLTHLSIKRQQFSLRTVTPALMLPVLPLIVAAGCGGVLAPALNKYNEAHALTTVVFSLIMNIIGISASLAITTLYVLRLIVHGYPTGSTIITAFLPLGPAGQGGYALLMIGQAFKDVLPLNYAHSVLLTASSAGDILNGICIAVAFVLWSNGLFWLFLAIIGVQENIRHDKIPFTVPFWGLVFPNGVFALCTIQLGHALDSKFFRILGATLAIITIILYFGVLIKTILKAFTGEIFDAPCLEDLDRPNEKRLSDAEARESTSTSATRS
jgi:tellurite resistance protein TehA-like permease